MTPRFVVEPPLAHKPELEAADDAKEEDMAAVAVLEPLAHKPELEDKRWAADAAKEDMAAVAVVVQPALAHEPHLAHLLPKTY